MIGRRPRPLERTPRTRARAYGGRIPGQMICNAGEFGTFFKWDAEKQRAVATPCPDVEVAADILSHVPVHHREWILDQLQELFELVAERTLDEKRLEDADDDDPSEDYCQGRADAIDAMADALAGLPVRLETWRQNRLRSANIEPADLAAGCQS